MESSKHNMEGGPPWKEPCVVCGNAVFLAQRLRVEGKLYHRTCFRCARCNAQLSTADYYETHDGQYCCETCPDEVMEESSKIQMPIVEPQVEVKDETTPDEPILKKARPLPQPEPSPSHKSSLVAMRRMLFDSYDKDTDDAKLTRFDNKPMESVNKLAVSKNDLSNNDDSSSQIQFINNDSKDKDNVHKIIDDKLEDSPPCVELTHTDSSFNDSINLDENVNNVLVDSLIKSDVEIDSVKLPSEPIDSLDTRQQILESKSPLSNKEEEEEKSITLHTDNDLEIESETKTDSNKSDETHNLEGENLAIKITDIPKEEEPKMQIPSPKENVKTNETVQHVPVLSITKSKSEDYPEDLNPFGDDDEEDEKDKTQSSNPFGSDSEESESEKSTPSKQMVSPKSTQSTPSRPVSSNPFGSDEEDEEETKPPVPMPRKHALPSPTPMPRNRLRGSQRSLNSVVSVGSLTSPRKKKPAPPPPVSPYNTLTSPRSRKNKRAPLPPSLDSSRQSLNTEVSESSTKISDDTASIVSGTATPPRELRGEQIAVEISNIADQISGLVDASNNTLIENYENLKIQKKNSLNEDENRKQAENEDYKIINESKFEIQKKSIPQTPPPKPKRLEMSYEEIKLEPVSPTPSASTSNVDSLTYQEEIGSPPTEKESKDSLNMHRKISEERGVYTMHKSTHGQWRRKKAPVPPLPLPKRRPVKPMPIQNIKQELHDIEIKQQGLERQGVALENKIRDKFDTETSISPYVEELVLQLFELVNEKNELFRKQAELMYLRRQHNLEEEHAELEYQIRCLMARPEVNKTDSDKELEEQLIQRLVEVVERRDAVVQCLEMDRLREAEEDKSISTSLGIFTQTMGQDGQSKSVKTKHKKKKDKHKNKTLDLDKDLDESEKDSKKKKKWYTLQHLKTKHL